MSDPVALAAGIRQLIAEEGLSALEAELSRGSHYLSAYQALLAAGRAVSDDRTLHVLDLATYGWMPAILRLRPSAVFGAETWREAKECRSFDAALALISGLSDSPDPGHSWIAASKVLHALNPACFPMLDGRVGEALNLRPHELRTQKSYLSFSRAMIAVIQESPPGTTKLIERAAERLTEASPPGAEITPLRALDYMLFAIGGWE